MVIIPEMSGVVCKLRQILQWEPEKPGQFLRVNPPLGSSSLCGEGFSSITLALLKGLSFYQMGEKPVNVTCFDCTIHFCKVSRQGLKGESQAT